MILTRIARMNQLMIANRLRKQIANQVMVQQTALMHGRSLIGSREVVGHGFNETDEIKKLREKEKGDWNKLSLEEKKKLYRHSFCLTLSEVDAPTGEWKIHLSIVMYTVSMALLFFILARKYFYGPLPASMSLEGKQAQRDLEIKYKTNPIFGLASKFDYEKGDWK
ncbi:hypothetical protein RDWZM_007041 [Blomia tropicalis]|uniref:Cytochrome c oxidase subunit 4 n=1 Tax=Blomia tropicalis TaxID=40697 RepID=A0A9Q0RNX7_BLOTA|nr:hypothetical protein RDWZM_007041 [Blomia tropicalis]